ncbi:DUF6230 family protein [Streptomyces sp. NPDC092296]|uniref:DUF6230 family protein n=1 Tax=Streptomyces sp. NPDC092296 TaxID=3366012 RepID=UPI003812735E
MSQTHGKTRWKRFAVVMVPSIAATAAIGVSLAQGALAASFSVSGQQFKVTAKHLDGYGFAQYGSVVTETGFSPSDTSEGNLKKAHAVAVSTFKTATINKLCQSVVIKAPFIGDVTLNINAGDNDKKPVTAENLVIGLDDLKADAKFTGINIGVAAGSVSKGNVEDQVRLGAPTSFAQEADRAELDRVSQTAWVTTAGTFTLNGLHMAVNKGSNPCPDL